MKKILLFIFIPVLLVLVGVPIALISYNKQKTQSITDNTSESNKEIAEQNPQGTILIEAGTGTLIGEPYFSYIDESARGLEAYLGDKGVSAMYEFSSENTGKYTLWVKLSDDGVHESGARNVTIVVNNSQTLGYIHTSEDTKGWKWYKVGDTPLSLGSNTVVFTKDEDTTAAFVMDEFKFVPVKE